MTYYKIIIDISFDALNQTAAEQEAKRIYGGVDDLMAEQNDPKTTLIKVMLHQPLRVISTSKARVK